MKRIFLVYMFLAILLSHAAGDIYNRPLSESQTFYIPSDAVNNDVVGTVLAYPEFHELGAAPTFVLKTNVNNIYAVSSSGVITIADRTKLVVGDDIITITIKKNGYSDKDIKVTITILSSTTSTIFIDPQSPTNGTGTRANPKNSLPDLNINNGYRYWFKRGTTLTLTSQMAAMGNQTNKYFCSYGQGVKAKLVGNNIRIFAVGSGCSNIIFCELELDALNPLSDGSNWLATPIYFTDSNGGMVVSHCTISHGLTGSGTGVTTAIPGLSYLFNKIRTTKYDGLYINKVTGYTKAIGNDIDDVNWAYQFVGTDESQSGGDCIQFSASDNIIVRGNYLNHSRFGNKFCIIVEDGSFNRYTAEVTDNYCLAPPNNAAIYIQGYKTGSRISRNYTSGGQQGISSAGSGGDIQIDYNVVTNTAYRGITGVNANIYNNVFINFVVGLGTHTSGYALKNNIFYFTSPGQIAYNSNGSSNYSNNLYNQEQTDMFGTGRSKVSGQTGEANSIVGNPSFISSTDFHLNLTSPCVKAGIAVGLLIDKDSVSISGSPDIGAYECNSSSPSIPVYQNSLIANTTPDRLEMTYDQTLANIIPINSAFSVLVNSVVRSINTVAVSGTKVTLTLSSPVAFGDIVKVSYTIPATNPLQTAAGGLAASISNQPVTNNVTASVPVYQGSVIQNATPSLLEMTYNLSLANIVPSATAFSVQVNSVARSINSVAVSGTKVTLTLSSPVAFGDIVNVSYTKPATNPLQTSAGGLAASISNQPVTNNVAATVPVYQGAVIQNATPSILEITYNLNLANIVPAAAAFSVLVNSVPRTVNSVSISGTKVLLTLSSPVVYGNNITITYTKPLTNPIQTTSGGQAASFTAQPVTNNVTVPGNQPPAVSLSSPANNSTYVAPATVTISATASDIDGSVAKVEFFNGGTKLGETTTTPYLYVWNNVVSGTYQLTAVATDNLNAKSTSSSVSISVSSSSNQPPVISISSPTKNSSFIAPASITIDVNASDPDGTISKVAFFNGSTNLGETTTAPYSFTWKNVTAGIYSITAVATDNLNLTQQSSPVLVVVRSVTSKKGQIKISHPGNGNRFARSSIINITIDTNDPDSTISRVDYFIDTTKIGESTKVPYSFSIENANPGSYDLTAVACDNLDTIISSSVVSIIVTPFEENSKLINLFPNPNDGHFSIEFLSSLKDEKNIITITNLTGKIIYKDMLTNEENLKYFDLSNISSGIYVLIVTGNDIAITKKFIKK
jgi:uncharacterized repeat protein (TIGR02059 family)